jgi:alkylhydroperoxidase family enzyme
MPRLENANWEADPSLHPLVERIVGGRGQVGELYGMLLHCPIIAEGLLQFGTAVRQKAQLDGQIRELVICRVGLLLDAEYEVFRHRELAEREGVTTEQLDALEYWRETDLFSPAQRAALAYSESITRDIKVPDEVFEPLREHFDTREIVELTMTAAYYNMISRFLEALHISVPPELKPASR